jgi:DNA-binding response OmpR family regulator
VSRTILLLDDDTWLADTYCRVLIRAGYRVHYASDARSGIDLLDEHPDIELGLVDLMLPGPNGISFLYEVVSQLDWQDKQFIVMSHQSRREVSEDDYLWQQLNVREYLYKPSLRPEHLVTAVEKVLA